MIIYGRIDNSRFAKAGVSCFNESEVLNSSFVHLMKFSSENPCLFVRSKTLSAKNINNKQKQISINAL